MMFLDSFLLRAGLAGIGVALAAGPLGCFVVWRRMAYFSDAMAHAAILGVALSLIADMSVFGGVQIVAILAAVLVHVLGSRGQSTDTLLGVIAHSALAFGLVAVALVGTVRVDLMAYLFGDILAVSRGDLLTIWGGAAVVLGILWLRWSALLTATLSEDMARAAGLHPGRDLALLTLTLALVIAAAIKVVGALLIGALLLIPAATARSFANSPERMALLATLIGAAAAIGGLALAWQLDTPAGPSIVCVAALFFALSRLAALRPFRA